MEGGAYGGFIPNAVTVAPTTDTWAAGLYGAATQGGVGASTGPLAREEARFGVRRSATVGTVQEAEALVQLWSTSLALGAGGRLRRAALVDQGPVVELAYGDVRFQPASSVRASMQLRYIGVAPESQPLLRSEVPTSLGGYHGTVDLSWGSYRWLGLGMVANANRDLDSGLDQASAGRRRARAPAWAGSAVVPPSFRPSRARRGCDSWVASVAASPRSKTLSSRHSPRSSAVGLISKPLSGPGSGSLRERWSGPRSSSRGSCPRAPSMGSYRGST